ncbi:sigma-54-dependent Fis family transcriptional regulator [Burkholderia cepacia]|uniref:Fis family GAF modulated sigma54 specific transcriptional regulator n=1 Tax=Burkholderia cepacia GG4 TaxID=1009846 RepID=A0A9W3K8E6_BURCE|nr:sigma-54-dependent Fis family transcriptional regulator [Burkholderia cepacia]AFQ52190.1 Fis family GAF modulated sigma54 specific transcriptional regulator [Burkholderia cepacia GG4]
MPLEIHRAKGSALAAQTVRASWQRSGAAGLIETQYIRPPVVSRDDILAAKDRNCKLLKYGEPSVENSYEQVAGTCSVVLLADATGTILSSRGDDEFMLGEQGRFFLPGVCWSERVAGTNAIGTCLANRAPISIDMAEHYLIQYRSLCGSAAPVFDSGGRIVGAIAAYSTNTATQLHTLAFIRTVAILIENRMLAREMANEIIISFHPIAEHIGTIKQGIVVFGHNGRLLGLNSAARSILHIDSQEEVTSRFAELFAFDFSLESLVEKVHASGNCQFTALLRDGREVTLVVSIGAASDSASSHQRAVTTQPLSSQSSSRAKREHFLLKDLDLGDPQIQRAILKASMILGSDIPLLIEGESGVGKEVFSAAFHNSGPRNGGPFVAVNCAAIPEGLIESELFGYEEGAFTGAKKKGYPGKILQANRGTLFLDEIGDMPISLQTRLLRVLQERQVTPLGSTHNTPVDVSIVCATHRSMRAEIAAGRFREDLYYRLNGLRIHLPALRERKDIDRLIDFVIETESGGRRIDVAPNIRSALRTHPWPGNIRQLQMVLRTALAILGNGNHLELQHLPDEFLQSEESSDFSIGTARCGDLAHIELEAMRRAVDTAGGNMSEAARTLGISRKTLYRKLKRTPPK